jgi:hypothetical protein
MKKVFLISLISAGLLLNICCQSKKKVTDSGTKEPDFAIEVSPPTQWVSAGDSAEFQIKLTSLNGFSAPCTLSVAGFPEKDSVAFNSDVLVPTDSSQLTIYTTFSTPRETYALVITGKNGKIIHNDTVTLLVPSEKVTDYYPLAIGNSWSYVWLDEEGEIKFTDTQSIIDTDTINGNFGYISPFNEFTYVKGDTIFCLWLNSMTRFIVLLGPLVIGQSWSARDWNYELIEFGPVTLTDGTKYENCLKLRKVNPDFPGDETFEWWAKDVGYVKMKEYYSGQYQGSRELVSYTLH